MPSSDEAEDMEGEEEEGEDLMDENTMRRDYQNVDAVRGGGCCGRGDDARSWTLTMRKSSIAGTTTT